MFFTNFQESVCLNGIITGATQVLLDPRGGIPPNLHKCSGEKNCKTLSETFFYFSRFLPTLFQLKLSYSKCELILIFSKLSKQKFISGDRNNEN